MAVPHFANARTIRERHRIGVPEERWVVDPEDLGEAVPRSRFAVATAFSAGDSRIRDGIVRSGGRGACYLKPTYAVYLTRGCLLKLNREASATVLRIMPSLSTFKPAVRVHSSASPPSACARASHDQVMLQLLILVGRALALGVRGHRELVLENLALRHS
jgi:hypothetical protein